MAATHSTIHAGHNARLSHLDDEALPNDEGTCIRFVSNSALGHNIFSRGCETIKYLIWPAPLIFVHDSQISFPFQVNIDLYNGMT
jgi:hypothetical protein